jgi:hypothetical protein
MSRSETTNWRRGLLLASLAKKVYFLAQKVLSVTEVV